MGHVIESNEVPGKLATQLAPPEVWSLIFKQLKTDSKGLHACYQLSEMGKSLLEDERTDFLFPQIFPLIRKYVKDDIPRISRVSQTWRFSVEDYYKGENIDSEFTIDNNDYQSDFYSRNKLGKNGYWTFKKTLDVERFCKSIPPFPATMHPFVTKQLQLLNELHATEESFRMWKLVTEKLLPKVGSNIQACTFEFGSDYNSETIKVVLLEALKHLPNLRVLILIGPETFRPQVDHSQRLMQFLGVDEVNPLPKLENLTTLNIFQVPMDIVQELLSENLVQLEFKNLTDLEFNSLLSDQKPKMTTPNFKNLRRLCLPEGFSTIFDTEIVRIAPPLLQYLIICEELHVREVIQITSHYKNLKGLDISVEDSENFQDSDIPWNLPNLETLKIYFGSTYNLPSIDFALPLNSLQHLEVWFARLGRRRKTIVDFIDLKYRLHESNIWWLMPTLKRFFFQDSLCYRGRIMD